MLECDIFFTLSYTTQNAQRSGNCRQETDGDLKNGLPSVCFHLIHFDSILAAALLSSVALIVAAWVRTVARSSWSADVHVDFALLDGLDDCSLSTAAGYEIELGIGKEVLELTVWLIRDLA